MKSPWSMLFGFGSRKKAADEAPTESEKHIGPLVELTPASVPSGQAPPALDEDPAELLESTVVELKPKHLTSDETSDLSVNDFSVDIDTENASKLQSETPELVPVQSDSSVEPARATRDLPPKRSRRANIRRMRHDQGIHEAAVPHEQASTSEAELAIRLDDDIKALREELGEKLRAQNAQLKMMLKRFN